ncbi:AAA family ATPase [Acetobacterium tundrae]|uniref:AAA family ATPase n=1 Tax=Acetobacterium tundrae TaxID=132932 RepID=A0ABR6WHU6_9FIRM|nr:AAA family ATPase [Acetobacterium tundrae]MBC3796035.1 AAA family ATPase [Acetobacterium tundrae]
MQPYIKKIQIKNFRNFKNCEFELKQKAVLIGENGVGKSNLLRALQLILDPSLSEEDRFLDEGDFYEGLVEPIKNGEEIIISIYIDGYNQAKNILCQLSDATVNVNGRKLLKITYKYFQDISTNGIARYRYIVFKGDDENNLFTYEDRKHLNIKVIKAIRDVENEMKNSKSSPLTKLVKHRYIIQKEDLEKISTALKKSGADILDLPEINDLQREINNLFNDIVSYSENFDVTLRTVDIDASRILYALKPLINSRDSYNTSLGINNIFYITLMLLLIQDCVIKTFLSIDEYDNLCKEDTNGTLPKCYKKEKNKYYLKNSISKINRQQLYEYMYEHNNQPNGITILAIEEPEAHLHPIYQRLLYKYSVAESEASVLITTHSTHLSSVAPLSTIVHLLCTSNGTQVHTTANIQLGKDEIIDLERYIDIKRGEIYLAKGIIFVEGIGEEYLIPQFASLLNKDLDKMGIIICNVNSTNFEPFKIFADELGIPNAILTDGDYYYTDSSNNERVFGTVSSDEHKNFGYNGNERMLQLCAVLFSDEYNQELKKLDYSEQDAKFEERGIFVGAYTLEIDIFAALSSTADKEIIFKIFNKLTAGKTTQKSNFKKNFEAGKYDKCLNQITSSHSNIGKGRFSQRLAANCTAKMIPDYIKNAIEYISDIVCEG